MSINLDFKDSNKHSRLVEFHESKFYYDDFVNKHFTFLTAYDDKENIILEFAHILNEFNGRMWITPSNDCITCGSLISSLVESCKKYDKILIDLYVDDIFKPSPSLQAKRIFRYSMTMGTVTRKMKGGNHKHGVEQLYNLDAVSDMKCFHDFNQMMNEL